ncbi:PAS domain S-box protein [Alkalispirochaeta americana]|nr:PAS domain S-box protein [Alkalispirochaeta americana]
MQQKRPENTLLVVEDDHGLRELIIRVLEKAGYLAEGVSSGREALERIASSSPVAVLLDQSLPDMTGKEVIIALLERDIVVPFIVMTGQGDERFAVEMMKLGAADYLIKYIDFLDSLPLAVGRLFKVIENKRAVEAAEARLKESEERFRFLVNHSGDLIWVLQLNGIVSYVSPSWKNVVGGDPGSIAGKEFLSFIHPDDQALFHEYTEKVLAARKTMGGPKYRSLHHDGTWRWHEGRITPVCADDGSVLYFVGVSRDITEQRRAEEEVQRQLNEKELLLKEVHHRVKNNIATIEHLLLLQAGLCVHPEAQGALQEAVSRVESMHILYQKLLLTDDHQSVSVKEYVESLLESLVDVFKTDKLITIEKDIADFRMPPERVVSFGIIINELVTNVFKYAFQGRPGGFVRVTVRDGEGGACLVIADDGIGFAGESDGGDQGGFGLSLVRMLAKQLGATISMRSDGGTTVTVDCGP